MAGVFIKVIWHNDILIIAHYYKETNSLRSRLYNQIYLHRCTSSRRKTDWKFCFHSIICDASRVCLTSSSLFNLAFWISENTDKRKQCKDDNLNKKVFWRNAKVLPGCLRERYLQKMAESFHSKLKILKNDSSLNLNFKAISVSQTFTDMFLKCLCTPVAFVHAPKPFINEWLGGCFRWQSQNSVPGKHLSSYMRSDGSALAGPQTGGWDW